MDSLGDHQKLKDIYEEIALSKDERTTACDFNLRELEIETALSYIQDSHRVLDVGCGLGYALRKYAAQRRIEGYGIDYAENMIRTARQLQVENQNSFLGTIEFTHASVLDLPFQSEYFDVVTSSRCLMALLDWERQKGGLVEISRVIKPGGVLVLMEGTIEGLDRLNEVRGMFGLGPIDASGRDRLCTLKFKEQELLRFSADYFSLERVQRFGMYYFLSRIVHPLLIAPDSPRYDARINEVAREIARKIPDFMGIGHLVAFVFRKLKEGRH
jgi:ubiquinone/menaquinone biosynthesis C-methylase UbiE